MKICYKMTAGRARDVRFVDEGYVPGADETVIDGDALPAKGALDNPTPAHLDAEKTTEANELRHTKRALAACLEVLFVFVKDPALFGTAAQLKQAVADRYKTNL